jgi:hypothetical protein
VEGELRCCDVVTDVEAVVALVGVGGRWKYISIELRSAQGERLDCERLWCSRHTALHAFLLLVCAPKDKATEIKNVSSLSKKTENLTSSSRTDEGKTVGREVTPRESDSCG